jgi:hypothetical protein
MRLTRLLLVFVICCTPALSFSETLREIELSDGSVIRAEVVSLSHGTYRLRSATLGEIEVPEHKVKTIRSLAEDANEPSTIGGQEGTSSLPVKPIPAPVATPSAEDLQQTLQQDPAALNKILSLQGDPLVRSILEDADTMRAVQAGDIGTLLNDPKIRALMNHPTVRELNGKYGQ